jgi:hypothetical protein
MGTAACLSNPLSLRRAGETRQVAKLCVGSFAMKHEARIADQRARPPIAAACARVDDQSGRGMNPAVVFEC